MDLKKKARFHKPNTVDELGLQDNLDVDAKVILQRTAKTFLEACFNRESACDYEPIFNLIL